jgi:hypothetical protein
MDDDSHARDDRVLTTNVQVRRAAHASQFALRSRLRALVSGDHRYAPLSQLRFM